MTKDENEETDECILWSFYQRIPDKLNDLAGWKGIKIKPSTIVIPFFSPAETTQFLLVNLESDQIIILDLSYIKNAKDPRGVVPEITIRYVRYKGLKALIGSNRIHSACSTDLSKNIVLLDTEDMHVLDMTTYNENTFWVRSIITHKFMYIQGIHLFSN